MPSLSGATALMDFIGFVCVRKWSVYCTPVFMCIVRFEVTCQCDTFWRTKEIEKEEKKVQEQKHTLYFSPL